MKIKLIGSVVLFALILGFVLSMINIRQHINTLTQAETVSQQSIQVLGVYVNQATNGGLATYIQSLQATTTK